MAGLVPALYAFVIAPCSHDRHARITFGYHEPKPAMGRSLQLRFAFGVLFGEIDLGKRHQHLGARLEIGCLQ